MTTIEDALGTALNDSCAAVLPIEDKGLLLAAIEAFIEADFAQYEQIDMMQDCCFIDGHNLILELCRHVIARMLWERDLLIRRLLPAYFGA